MYSDDHGVSWSGAREITEDTKWKNGTWYATGPGAGIQLQKGRKRGRGLGLAIVKYIAGSLGGQVGVKPNKPKGNTFFLKLPAK